MSGTTMRFFLVIVTTFGVAVLSYWAALEGDPLIVHIGKRTYFALPYQFSTDQTLQMFAKQPVTISHVGTRPIKQKGSDGSRIFLYDASGGDGRPSWRMYKPL